MHFYIAIRVIYIVAPFSMFFRKWNLY